MPKVPVILIFVMVFSFLILVVLATNLVGYSSSFSNAEDAYAKGDYEQAFQDVAGLEVKEKDQDRSIFKEILGWLVYIAILLAAVYVLITYVGQRTEVSGHSMEPTLQHGDNLIVDKISYRFREPERYEIIVFPYQYKENTYYIKRIIGLPGETVQIIDGEVYINGELLADEHYGKEVMLDPGIAAESITLGDDEYFVLGDNRNHSSDSRDPSVGVLHRKDLIGRAWVRIWPFSDIGFIRHD